MAYWLLLITLSRRRFSTFTEAGT